MRHIARLIVVALPLIGTACAQTSASAVRRGPTPVDQPAVRRNSQLITQAEIEAARLPNLYLLIRNLQPRWLQMRAPTRDTGGTIVVYLDGTRMGGPEVLQRISSAGIGEVRYLTGLEADTVYGRGHENGAIVITTQ